MPELPDLSCDDFVTSIILMQAPPPAPGMALNSKEPRIIELKGTVGFDSLPQQYVKKAMANG